MEDFNLIYTRFYKSMYRIARKMIGCSDEINDVVQDVFVDFFNRNQNGSPIQQPKAWLYRAMLNKCVDRHRRNKFVNRESIVSDRYSDEETAERKEVKVLMDASIAKLKVDDRKLVILYSEGFSYKEMAEVTGIQYTSIGKTLARALQKLKQELKRAGYEMFD